MHIFHLLRKTSTVLCAETYLQDVYFKNFSFKFVFIAIYPDVRKGLPLMNTATENIRCGTWPCDMIGELTKINRDQLCSCKYIRNSAFHYCSSLHCSLLHAKCTAISNKISERVLCFKATMTNQIQCYKHFKIQCVHKEKSETH